MVVSILVDRGCVEMVPLEDCVFDRKIYFKKKLKWYEKIWYFLTGKKNDLIECGSITDINYEG